MIICFGVSIYILIILFIWGSIIYKEIERCLGMTNDNDVFDCLLVGYVGVTIYAEIFSLFYKVSILANIVLLGLTCLLVLLYKNTLCKRFIDIYKKARNRKSIIFISIFVFFMMVYISATPIVYASSGDLGFYHAQCVHWIEEYGVTPGLANLFIRSGYNCANFSIDALFSFNDLFGIPLKIIGVILPSVVCLKMLKGIIYNVHNRELSIYSIFIFIYTAIMILEFDNYSSEIASNYIVFYAIYKWIDITKREKTEYTKSEGYGCCALLLLFATSIKLVVAPICILVLFPLYRLIKEKKMKKIFIFLLFSLIITVPWLIRNVISSGWILFPYTFLDIFDFDWKTPKSAVDLFRETTGLIMKRVYANTSEVPTIRQWVKGFLPFLWNPSGFNKYLLRMVAILLVLTPTLTIITRVVLFIKGKTVFKEYTFIRVSMYFCIVCYFFFGPDSRYFCQVLIPLAAIELSIAVSTLFGEKNRGEITILCVLSIILLVPSLKNSVSSLIKIPYGIGSYIIYPGYLVEIDEEDNFMAQNYRGYVFIASDYSFREVDGLKIWYRNRKTKTDVFYDPFPGIASVHYLDSNYGITPHARGNAYRYGFYGVENIE